jgi:hypothetical protein
MCNFVSNSVLYSSTASPFTFPSLPNKVPFTFTITAFNEIGGIFASAASDALQAMTPIPILSFPVLTTTQFLVNEGEIGTISINLAAPNFTAPFAFDGNGGGNGGGGGGGGGATHFALQFAPTIASASAPGTAGNALTNGAARALKVVESASVDYAFISGSAVRNADFTGIDGTLTWPAGDYSARDITFQVSSISTRLPMSIITYLYLCYQTLTLFSLLRI